MTLRHASLVVNVKRMGNANANAAMQRLQYAEDMASACQIAAHQSALSATGSSGLSWK